MPTSFVKRGFDVSEPSKKGFLSGPSMPDELERLAGCPTLRGLLQHYDSPCGEKPDAWQDRIMHLEGVADSELVKLHGELIAHQWVEQNTGGPGCGYRITPVGHKALGKTGQ
jgi:hypothetical protein